MINTVVDYLCSHCVDDGECFEDCDDIKNIKSLLSVILQQKSNNDTISRQAVLDYIYNNLGLGDEENGKDLERQKELEDFYNYVKSLPTQPKPMKISEVKKKIVIDNYFKKECDVNTSIKEAFTKGFEVGLNKALTTS